MTNILHRSFVLAVVLAMSAAPLQAQAQAPAGGWAKEAGR